MKEWSKADYTEKAPDDELQKIVVVMLVFSFSA